MPSTKPKKNDISSAKEFKTLCIAARKAYKIRVSDEAIRHLRLTMNTTVASASLLPEAIDVIFACVAERKKRCVGIDDVREWLAAPGPGGDDGSSDEEERSAEEDLTAEKLHYVCKLLNWKREKRQTYYLVEWEATWEPREHLSQTIVAAFEKERRLLVRKKFIEEEAVEDNTINTTEG